MFKKPTVFVLGAGASVPYGLPTGSDLAKSIKRTYIHPPLKVFADDEKFIDLKRRFRESRVRTIDQFLGRLPVDDQLLGKWMIAAEILQAEETSLSRDGQPRGSFHTPTPLPPYPSFLYSESDWMMTLFELMDRDACVDTFADNKLTIVTFNYDRLFEWALYSHIKETFSLSKDDKIKLIIDEIPVYHVYGHLEENLSYQPLEPCLYNVDHADRTESVRKHIKSAAEGIRVVGERAQDQILASIHDALSKADRVVFLGFGFDEDNINLLFPNGTPQERQHSNWSCYASGHGLTESQKKLAKRKSKIPLGFGHKSWDAKTYLDEIIDELVD